MEENPKPRRRWFRFSLRTMLVLVTVISVYLGWAANWKRQRREFLKSLSGAYVDRSETIAPWPLELLASLAYLQSATATIPARRFNWRGGYFQRHAWN